VRTSDRWTARVGSILSAFISVWGLLAVGGIPYGSIAGAVAAVFAVAFGLIALANHAWGRWRKVAIAGIAIGVVTLLIFAVLLAFLV
jgi:hypothetical protein